MTIGRLEPVAITDVWPNEANDFTPWLEENLEQLGEVLHLNLEPNGREVRIGNYALDLLATDSETGRMVAIENQINQTDHTHLGQALTYAAGLEAGTIVWIATEFRDEHRAALDWLNRMTIEDVDFFGIRVSAVRIGNSMPAAQFTVAAAPNHWSQQLKTPQTPPNQREEQYLAFWEPLLTRLNEHSQWTISTKNRRSYYSAGSGMDARFVRNTLGMSPGTFTRTMRFTGNREARVEWNIQGEDRDKNKEIFDKLTTQEPWIHAAMGELRWERLEDARMSRLAAVRPGSVDAPPEELDAIRDWMYDGMTKFPAVMAEQIQKALQDAEPNEEKTAS